MKKVLRILAATIMLLFCAITLLAGFACFRQGTEHLDSIAARSAENQQLYDAVASHAGFQQEVGPALEKAAQLERYLRVYTYGGLLVAGLALATVLLAFAGRQRLVFGVAGVGSALAIGLAAYRPEGSQGADQIMVLLAIAYFVAALAAVGFTFAARPPQPAAS